MKSKNSIFEDELFYKAFLGFKEIDWDFFDSIFITKLRKIYTQAFYDVTDDDSSYDKAISKFIEFANNENFLELLESARTYAGFIKIMLMEYPERSQEVALEIQIIEDLYDALQAMSNTKLSLKERFEKILLCMINSVLCKYENERVIEKISASSKQAEVVILSVGSGNNKDEICPPFAEHLANTSGPVTVYNYDRIWSLSDLIKEINQNPIECAYGIEVEMPHDSRMMPSEYLSKVGINRYAPDLSDIERFQSTYENNKILFSNSEILKKHKDRIQEQATSIIDSYVSAFTTRKQADPSFKVVILYSCSAAFSTTMKELAQKLIASGLFTQGEDIELVHAYAAHSPVVVYRGPIENIPYPNKILATTGPETLVPCNYDTESETYTLPRLENLTHIFTENLLEHDHKSDSRTRKNSKP